MHVFVYKYVFIYMYTRIYIIISTKHTYGTQRSKGKNSVIFLASEEHVLRIIGNIKTKEERSIIPYSKIL